MKILLVGINAKYIHSNLAIYSLRAYAKKRLQDMSDAEYESSESDMAAAGIRKETKAFAEETEIRLSEYTINQPVEQMIQSIYEENPGLLCISCYIWNIAVVQKIVTELPKLLPKLPIWLGGPEVSFDLSRQFKRFPLITGIMYGEGEDTFYKLIMAYGRDGFGRSDYENSPDKDPWKEIKGIAYRKENGCSIINPPADAMDFNELPFPYDDLKDFENRIIYYETSRGCPFTCSYCLSSVEKTLRFRSLDKVFAELQLFLNAKVKQVKFVDRTFNCNHHHAVSILKFIREHDNGVTNFHFEIAGDILTEEEIRLIGSLRPGLIRLEIGVQSTNEQTLHAICRRTDLCLLKKNVKRILEYGNVRLHLDLIAGLPYEDIHSMIRSFNEVYRMGGHELQLGFLKLLRGTPIMEQRREHNIVCTDFPPYEVLFTKELSYRDMIRLKAVEEMLEIYHNSGQFRYSEQYLLMGEKKLFASPFELYDGLAEFYKRKNYPVLCSARERRYEILLEYVTEAGGGNLKDDSDNEQFVTAQDHGTEEYLETLREYMAVDYFLRENAKARPAFAPEIEPPFCDTKKKYSDWRKTVYRKEAEKRGCDSKQLERQTHMEILYKAVVVPGVCMPQILFFDYHKRSPVTGEAKLTAVLDPMISFTSDEKPLII